MVKITIKKKISNHLMSNGNKSSCEKILFKNFKLLQKFTKKNDKKIIKYAIINVAPTIQLRQIKKKKRKSIKEFPYVLKQKNRVSLGMKNIIKTQTKSNKKTLFEEIILIVRKKSEFSKINEATQKPILSKKKYIFFRWFF